MSFRSKIFGYNIKYNGYIHRDYIHFKERDNAYNIYQQERDNQYQTTVKRYQSNYLKSVHLSIQQQKEWIANSADITNEEELVKRIEIALKKTLADGIDHAITANNENILQTYEGLSYQDLANKIVNSHSVKDLETLLAAIDKAKSLIGITGFSILAQSVVEKDFNKTLTNLSKLIQKDLAAWNNKVVTPDVQRILSALQSLDNMIKKINTSEGLSVNAMNSYLNNIFGTNLGELVVGKGLSLGLNTVVDFVGYQTHASTTDWLDKKYIQQHGNKSNTFKVDNKFSNLQIQIDEKSINVDLGLSVKWYNARSAGSYGVKVASEVELKHRLNQLSLINAPYSKYYINNTLASTNDDNNLYDMFKQMLIARNIDNAISGLGINGDFAQFIVINGQAYSVYDLIQAIRDDSLMSGHSSKKTNTNAMITASADGLAKVTAFTASRCKEKFNNLKRAILNSHEQQKLIDDLGFSIRLHIKNMKPITNSIGQ